MRKVISDASRDFLRILFSAGDFRAGAQKELSTLKNNFQLQTCMDGIIRGYLIVLLLKI